MPPSDVQIEVGMLISAPWFGSHVEMLVPCIGRAIPEHVKSHRLIRKEKGIIPGLYLFSLLTDPNGNKILKRAFLGLSRVV